MRRSLYGLARDNKPIKKSAHYLDLFLKWFSFLSFYVAENFTDFHLGVQFCQGSSRNMKDVQLLAD